MAPASRCTTGLLACSPTSVVALNAPSRWRRCPVQRRLGLVDELNLDGYYLYHAIRVDLLRRLVRNAEAIGAPTDLEHVQIPLRRFTGRRAGWQRLGRDQRSR